MARAQITYVVQNGPTGAAIPGAAVQIVDNGTSANATVYAASTGATTVANPQTTDASGHIAGWLATGSYTFTVSGAGITAYSEDVEMVAAADVLAGGGGGGTSSDYVFNVKAHGAVGDGVTDDVAGVQSAYDAAVLAGGGTVLFPSATYYMNNVSSQAAIKLTRDNAGTKAPITIQGEPGTVIKLSANTPRFVDFNKVADHDLFHDHAVQDFLVDANSATGHHHVIIGTYQSGTNQTRINIQRFAIRRIRAINALTDNSSSSPATVRQHVALAVNHATNMEATQDVITDILCEDLDLVGGWTGVYIAGGVATGLPNVANVFLDRIRLNRCKHDTTIVPTQNQASANVQIGSTGFGGACEIVDCTGIGSGDVGIEIDGMTYTDIVRSTFVDSWNNCYLIRNFNTPQNPSSATARLTACNARIVNLNPTFNGGAQGFQLGHSATPTPTLNHAVLRDCSFWTNAGRYEAPGQAISVYQVPTARVTVDGFLLVNDHINESTSTNQFPSLVLISPSVSAHVLLRNIYLIQSGTVTLSAGAEVVPRFISMAPQPGVSLQMTVDGVVVDNAITNIVAGDTRIMRLGEFGGGTGVLAGVIRRVFVKSWTGGDTAPKCIDVQPSTSSIISPKLTIEHCDFKNIPGGIEFVIDSSQASKVFLNQNAPRVFPVAPSGITLGASPYSYQNLDGYQERVIVSGGTVSAIAISQDNVTYYTTGQTSGSFVLDNGDYLRVTYTAAPTMTKIPAK